MFVPRQFQKKSVPHKPTSSTTASKSNVHPPPLLAPAKRTEADLGLSGVDNVDIVAAKEAVMSLEILLSDYSLEKAHGNWLKGKMREFEGKDDYFHLSAFIDCQYFSTIKPALSQVSLKKALIACKSDVLELSSDGYNVRRKAKGTLFSQNENQDLFTVYIEPDVPTIISNPGRAARILHESFLPRRYFPVQFVENTQKPWTFVTLSSVITEDDMTNKKLWPRDWIVLTKSEWQKRDSEYQALLRAQVRAVTLSRENISNRFTSNESNNHLRPETVNSEKHKIMNSDNTTSREEKAPKRIFSNESSFEKGLIIRLSNLHPSTTKIIIDSFITRSVDRYLRKKREKQEKSGNSLSSEDPPLLRISYIDYEKGLDEAYLRLGNPEDSTLIVRALKKRKRSMRSGEDTKGKKGEKALREENWVSGKILSGEEERIYWGKVLWIKGKKGKGKPERLEGKLAPQEFRTGNKRARMDSEASGPEAPKRLKFDQ
ncbi:uncharacterized protein H6S33_005849 [Morchella sextelata]|uniref:uncharacterized protein n=1 Tax=Morchella sextelata TaxID=1174677 RepID=UPI001D040C89|nr:uncharacterized protein H6S33_005849 [Morchella sextelata]KAH0613963.1 hypothetical protein H6S33_005849 [Morchella sextelata]